MSPSSVRAVFRAVVTTSVAAVLAAALAGTGCRCGEGPACGDGVLDPGESCDGAELGGEDCAGRGFAGGGALACSDDCTFETSACIGVFCRDGLLGPGEQCDGTMLGGLDCTTLGLGFDGGTLACNQDCTYDTSGCTSPVVCGDDVAAGGEECDGVDLAGADCTTAVAFSPGGTLGCTAACTFDTSGCTPPPSGDGCVPRGPGDPIIPGPIGACCTGARVGNPTAECMAPLGCLNGYCTLLACGSDADCAGTVAFGDRSPFPVGTTFGCVIGPPANAAINYCAPIGASRRECGGPSGVACAAGETCVLSWDSPELFGALCLTDVVQPASIPDLAEGDACQLSSVRPCSFDSDCRAGIEECTGGACVLETPYDRYQCSGTEGAGEFVAPGVFTVLSPFTGPGGLYAWEGGCYAGLLGGTPTCTTWCDPTGGPPCAAGLECARFDSFSEGNLGLCVAAECHHAYGPIPATDAINIAGLTVVPPAPCAVAADCAGENGGTAGARCLDTDGDGAADTCELTDRVTVCAAGTTCGRAVWSDFFDQGVPAMDALGRTDLDTFRVFCVPEMPGATGALGDTCEDGFDCVSGVCTRGDVYDPMATAAVATAGTCTAPCANDSACAAAPGNVCVGFGLFGGGATPTWPLCVPFDVLSGSDYCLSDGDCPAGEGCGVLSFRTGTGLCVSREGVLADQTPAGVAVTDDQPNGATCHDDIGRCLPGDDGVESSTAIGARTGSCGGDDVAVGNSTNCVSGLCLDGDDLTGGTADGPRVCSSICVDGSDCAGPQVCTNVLMNDNSTDNPSDDTALGWCRSLVPPAAGDRCNDTPDEATNDADCGALFPGISGIACDDGVGTAPPPFLAELSSGSCYATGGTIGSPCVDDAECNLGGRCLPDDGTSDPTQTFPGGYCVMDGCAFDPATRVGAGADCPGGFVSAGSVDATVACVATGAAGLCLKGCAGDDDCRGAGVDYSCQMLAPGSGVTVCWPSGM